MLKRFFTLAKSVRKIKPRITPGAAFLMIFFALAIDLVQIGVNFLLDEVFLIGFVIDWGITIAMTVALWLWFKSQGIKFIKVMSPKIKKKGGDKPTALIAFLITFIIKMIPVINALPAWTADVMINIGVSWVEDLAAQSESGGKALTDKRGQLSEGAKRRAMRARNEGKTGNRLGQNIMSGTKTTQDKAGQSTRVQLDAQGRETSRETGKQSEEAKINAQQKREQADRETNERRDREVRQRMAQQKGNELNLRNPNQRQSV